MKTLTTGEAAALCGVNFRTIIRWIERGLLTAHRLPGRGDHRILLEDFVQFLIEQKIPIPDSLQQLNSHSILVIDDQAEVARAYVRVLKKEGFDVAVANDGFNAGVKLLMLRPGLVILDLKMPGVDGFEVLKFIRQAPLLRNMKVLVASGQNDAALQQALDQGANIALAKPVTNADLVNEVSTLMNYK